MKYILGDVHDLGGIRKFDMMLQICGWVPIEQMHIYQGHRAPPLDTSILLEDFWNTLRVQHLWVTRLGEKK